VEADARTLVTHSICKLIVHSTERPVSRGNSRKQQKGVKEVKAEKRGIEDTGDAARSPSRSEDLRKEGLKSGRLFCITLRTVLNLGGKGKGASGGFKRGGCAREEKQESGKRASWES